MPSPRTILVTGGSGKLGRHVLRALADRGERVFNIDVAPEPDDIAPRIDADMSRIGDAMEVMGGIDRRYDKVDAVVHLAATARTGVRTNAATFTPNVAATYNVFEAARRRGVKRVVHASSEQVLGMRFTEPPPYLPVDEEYEGYTETGYALSKLLAETIAREFCRWDPSLTLVGLRYSNVMEGADYDQFAAWAKEPMKRRTNLWSYVDARDAAAATCLALDAPLAGSHTFIIAAADTVMPTPSAELAALAYPDTPLKRPLAGHESLQSIDKARRMLGYEPKHSWRTR
jgi:nucleoside-diphosphate-sugar epimerase